MVPTSSTQNRHIPVMLMESLENLKIKKNGVYVDGTLGLGGHSEIIIQQIKRSMPSSKTILGGPHVTLMNTAAKRETKRGLDKSDRASNEIANLIKIFDVLVCGDGELASDEAVRARELVPCARRHAWHGPGMDDAPAFECSPWSHVVPGNHRGMEAVRATGLL